MKKFISIMVSLFVVLLLSANTLATVPEIIPVQGVLTDSADQVLNGGYNLTFYLYESDVGGSALWSETLPAVAVNEGFFTVYLGVGDILLLDVVLTANELWLSMAVDGGEEMGRVRLASVPFALEAEVCHQIGDLYENEVQPLLAGENGCVSGYFLRGWDAGVGAPICEEDRNSGTGGIETINVTPPITGGGSTATVAIGVDVGTNSSQVAAGDHQHDSRYYTETELSTNTAAQVHWNNLTGLPPDFNDGVDDVNDADSNMSNELITLITWTDATDLLSITEQGVTKLITIDNEADDLGDNEINNLSNVNASPSSGQVLEWNGSGWVAGDDDGVTGSGTTNTIVKFTASGIGDSSIREEPNDTSPNIIGGYSGNSVTNSDVFGAVISGGGTPNFSDRPNLITDSYCTIGGGIGNQAGGDDALASNNQYSTVGGGRNNEASGEHSTVGGGFDNKAEGNASTIAGGYSNRIGADGHYSFTAGRRATANNKGCFVWGDSNSDEVPCNDNNRWVARVSGGVYFYTSSDLSDGVYVAANGSSWASVSDRNKKENFEKVNTQEVLNKVVAIPMETWNYKTQDDSIRHMGPMAQEFSAFGLGDKELTITTIDADGVALAAIQGLNKKLEQENAALRARLDKIESRLEKSGTDTSKH